MGDGSCFVGGSDQEEVALCETYCLGSDPESQRGWKESPTKTNKMKRKRLLSDQSRNVCFDSFEFD